MPELTGAPCPERAALAGRYVTLEPLARAHADALHEAGREQGIWTYLPYGPWPALEPWTAWVDAAATSVDPLFYAVVPQRGTACGVVSFLRCEPEHGTIEIGHIWFGAGVNRTTAATEAIYLLARHAFDALGHRRLEWKCNAANAASRAAAERFGFTFEGVFRQHMIVKGANRDTAWYALLDSDWPAQRDRYERWLSPDNFDHAGQQLTPLAR